MRKLMLILAVFGLAGSLLAQEQMGTWKLNYAKSKLPPGMSTAKESIIVFRESDPNTIEATSTDIQKDGSVVTAKWTTPKSGGIQSYQQGGPEKGTTIHAVVVDPSTIYNVYMQNGKQVFLMKVTYGKDFKTFTGTAKVTDPQGKTFDGMWIFEKQ